MENFKENLYIFKEKCSKIINKMSDFMKPYWDKYKKATERWKFLESAIIMSLSFVFVFIIIFSVKASLKKGQVTIANNKAESLFYERDFDKSLEEFEKIQEDDEWPIWKVKMAEVYSVKREYLQSNTLLEEAMSIRNKIMSSKGKKLIEQDKELINYVVFTYFMNKDYENSLKIGEEFLETYGDYKPLIRTMYTVYMVNGEKDKAESLVKEYPVDPESAYDLAVLAKMEMILDNWDKGLDTLKDAWYKDKDEQKVFDIIAQAAAYNKNFILEKLTERSTKEPEELAYKLWIAKVYSISGESADMAEKYVKELEGLDVGNVNIKIIQSKTYQNLGDNEKAQALLNEIIKENGDSYIGYHTEAWHYYEKGQYDRALELTQKSILANKDYPDNYGFLIPDIMMKKGNIEEAEPYFRTALLKEPFNFNIMVKIANFYWYSAKDINAAYEYFNLASLVKPTDSEVYYNMALIKLSNNEIDKSIELLKKSISIDEAIPKYHRTLGTIYMNQEKYSDAITEVRYAYSADKSDALTLNNAGCFYISINGDLDRGMVNLKAAYDVKDAITDEEVKKAIEQNYTRAKALYDEFQKEEGASLKVPEFILFY